MFKEITKRLFGWDDAGNTPTEEIVDGRIIDPETGEPIDRWPSVNGRRREKEGNPLTEERQKNAEARRINSEHLTEENIPATSDLESIASEEISSEDIPVGDYPGFRDNNIPDGYLIFLGASGKSERTISEYGYDLKWWNDRKRIQHTTWRDIEKGINKMNAATARRKMATLRSYAKWLLREGYPRLHGEVARVIPPKVPGRVPKDRGSDDFRRLSNQAADMCDAGDRRGLWIGLMLCCGLRIGEIRGVELANEQNLRVIGKGNKERLVPAPKWLYDAIADDKNKTWRRVRRVIWSELRDMEVYKPHSLRHTYASELIRCGVQLEEIKELLGHANLNTTLIYAKIKVPEQITNRLGVERE